MWVFRLLALSGVCVCVCDLMPPFRFALDLFLLSVRFCLFAESTHSALTGCVLRLIRGPSCVPYSVGLLVFLFPILFQLFARGKPSNVGKCHSCLRSQTETRNPTQSASTTPTNDRSLSNAAECLCDCLLHWPIDWTESIICASLCSWMFKHKSKRLYA